ncbi:MAG TPA: amino acid ABC transporter permease [Pseudolysinimonas sp.]|nr:amino acid ABC transporter permease [Pseudolysinimonas sp.]
MIAVAGIVALLAAVVVALALPRTTATGAVLPGLFDPSRWGVFNDRAVWRSIGTGVLNTLRMAGAGAVLAIAIGILFSFVRTSTHWFIRVPSIVVLEFLRGMPVLLMMLFILLVFSTGNYWAGVLALGLYNGAVIGEILRSGIAALPRGQREGGLSIGLSLLATRLQIEFPQAVRNMLPIIIAQLVVLLKDTALAYVLAYPELLYTMTKGLPNFFGNRYLYSFFFVALLIYLSMNLLLSWIARLVAKRSAPGVVRGRPRIPRRGVHLEGDVDMSRVPDAGMGGGSPH